MLSSSGYTVPDHKIIIKNKTMKQISFISDEGHTLFSIENNSTFSSEKLFLDKNVKLRFSHSLFEKEARDPSAPKHFDFSIDLAQLYSDFYLCRYLSESQDRYFARVLVDLEKRI